MSIPEAAPLRTVDSIASEMNRHCTFLRFSHLQPLFGEFEAALRARSSTTSMTSTRSKSTFEWESIWSGTAGDAWTFGHWICAYCNDKHVSKALAHLATPLLETLFRLFPQITRSRDRWGYTMVHWACQYSARDVLELLLDSDPGAFLLKTNDGIDVISMAWGVRSPLGVQDELVDWLYEQVSEIEGGENLFDRPKYRLEAKDDPFAYEEMPLTEDIKVEPSISTMERKANAKLDELQKEFPTGWTIIYDIVRHEVLKWKVKPPPGSHHLQFSINGARQHLKHIASAREGVMPVGAKVLTEDKCVATVVKVSGGITYSIDYEDGDKQEGVKRNLITLRDVPDQKEKKEKKRKKTPNANLPAPPLAVGTHVNARWGGKVKDEPYPGVVTSYADTAKYTLLFEDNSEKSYVGKSQIKTLLDVPGEVRERRPLRSYCRCSTRRHPLFTTSFARRSRDTLGRGEDMPLKVRTDALRDGERTSECG